MSWQPDVPPEDRRVHDIAELSATALMCREKGHAWEHVTDRTTLEYRGEPKQITREFACSRCTTSCVELMHVPSFDILRRTYYYPGGYLLSAAATGGKRVDVRDIREARLLALGTITKRRRKGGAS